LKATNFPFSEFDNDVIPYLAIKDFGTTGLDGKTGEDGDFPGGKKTFSDLLTVFDEVGQSFKEKLNKKFKEIAKSKIDSY
jgi:hypothetical protein